MSILFRPDDAFAADFIPFYHIGEYHLFYLKDWRDPEHHGEGTPWWHVVTRDFVTFEDRGEALPRGAKDEQDLYVFTGSVIEADGRFHIYYTGHNHHLKDSGSPQEAIMHAVSDDLNSWTKDTNMRFFAPPEYEPHDWRDPFVFWNADAGEYWMLLAARKPSGPDRSRGCVACAVSTDLVTWRVREPLWEPEAYYTHECPDLFQIGDTNYLVWSEFSDRFRTRYRIANSLNGPWRRPLDDQFDDRAYYAAKTAGKESERFLFGWLPTREHERDNGNWQWGGNLVVHELCQRRDGSLSVRPPQSVIEAFTEQVALTPVDRLGTWDANGDTLRTDATGRYSVATLCAMPDECLISCEVTGEQHGEFGLLFRVGDELEHGYILRIEPSRNRIAFDRWPRPSMEYPFLVERPLSAESNESVSLRVIVDGTGVVAYANDEIALSCRMYEFRTGAVGVFATECAVRFSNLSLRIRG